WPDPEYLVRVKGDSQRILTEVRAVVHAIAPSRAVFGEKMLEDYVSESLGTPRLSVEVLALFAITALVLSAVGLYSLIMLAVTSQTKEIGVRMALGAGARRIVAGVVAEAARTIAAGASAGAILAAIALRAHPVQSMLFRVGASDGITVLAVTGML